MHLLAILTAALRIFRTELDLARAIPFVSRLCACLMLVVAVGVLPACGGSNSPSEDSSLTDHMAFANVVSDGSVAPAVITGELSYNGNGHATQIVVAAKASGDSSQVSLADMSPGTTQAFRITVSNPSGANQFQMHVQWIESGNSGYKSY